MLDTHAMPYSGFASAYDEMMSNVNYRRWVTYVVDLFALYKASPRRVLDLACGTGSVAVPMAQAGYELAGLDRAQEMLDVAERKARRGGVSIPWIQADMRDFRVEEPFDAGAVVDGVVPDEAELGRSPQLQGLADLPAEEPGGALEAGDLAAHIGVIEKESLDLVGHRCRRHSTRLHDRQTTNAAHQRTQRAVPQCAQVAHNAMPVNTVTTVVCRNRR